MPVPWSDKPTYIEECQNRAITIQQLRDLSVFLQRLSAVGLLRSSDGRRLHWFGLNMYDIRDILKQVIEFHEEQRGNGSKSRRSWVEFIATATSAALDLQPRLDREVSGLYDSGRSRCQC